jgi:sulfonate transport system ATP-binding protein
MPGLASGLPKAMSPAVIAQTLRRMDHVVDLAGDRAERDIEASGLAITARGLQKSFGPHQVLRGLDFHIRAGQFVAIVGRSGCGKSTLLRVIAGLEHADSGRVRFDATPQDGLSGDTRIMFQDARLLPWKRVIDNVALGLPASEHERAREVLDQVGLSDRADDWPAVLSGGQRQRVALARALAHSPKLLLLDEPLGALDALTRIEMQRLIEKLWHRFGFTALLVTHDIGEGIALADRVVLIESGKIGLDLPVSLQRPRTHGAAFAALEQRVLNRVLEQPVIDSDAEFGDFPLLRAASQVRWAI